jgi:hypothetical protein
VRKRLTNMNFSPSLKCKKYYSSSFYTGRYALPLLKGRLAPPFHRSRRFNCSSKHRERHIFGLWFAHIRPCIRFPRAYWILFVNSLIVVFSLARSSIQSRRKRWGAPNRP